LHRLGYLRARGAGTANGRQSGPHQECNSFMSHDALSFEVASAACVPAGVATQRSAAGLRSAPMVSMPGRQDMPSTIRKSDKRAQEIFVKTHDSAIESYGEGE